MDKKIVVSVICFIIAICLFAIIGIAIRNSDNNVIEDESTENSLEVNENTNFINISESEETVNETEIYSEIENEVETASSDVSEDNTRYLIKSVDSYIYVYYLTDENDEYLYKKTTISTDYLSQADIDDLEVGIEVVGIENLNKMLEDFE